MPTAEEIQAALQRVAESQRQAEQARQQAEATAAALQRHATSAAALTARP